MEGKASADRGCDERRRMRCQQTTKQSTEQNDVTRGRDQGASGQYNNQVGEG
jgi:hypothetical protein